MADPERELQKYGMSKTKKMKGLWQGFYVEGRIEVDGKVKREKLSPFFGSRDAAETTCRLIKDNREISMRFNEIYVTEK